MAEKRIPSLLVEPNKFCSGCGHGIVQRILAEVFDELELSEISAGAMAVGCACLALDTFGVDWVQAPHGRAAAVAVGMKRVRPECNVFTYQGDGDSLGIGFSETMYAAIRNENITVIIVNNGIYGMTGGQMSPTSLPNQKTATSPKGRDITTTGMPVNIIDMMKERDVAYLARGAVTTVKDIMNLKKYLKTAFEMQKQKKGYSLVEVLAPCPTNWYMTPEASLKHVNENVKSFYPVGEFVKNGEKVNA